MQDHLERALAVVRRDLEATGAPLPRVEPSTWQTWPGAESATLHRPDGSGMGVWVDPAQPQVEQVATLADQMQEWVLESGVASMTSWPECPDHPDSHPLEAALEGAAAVWVCPRSRRAVSEIGALGPS